MPTDTAVAIAAATEGVVELGLTAHRACPPTWIGDKVCDKKCDNIECGYDGGDCGIQVIYDNLEGFEIGTSKTARTEIFGDTFCRPYPNQSKPTVLNLNFLEETCKNVLQPSAGFINCSLYTGTKDDLSITNVISYIEGANLSLSTPNVSDPGILKGHANVSRKHEDIKKAGHHLQSSLLLMMLSQSVLSGHR